MSNNQNDLRDNKGQTKPFQQGGGQNNPSGQHQQSGQKAGQQGGQQNSPKGGQGSKPGTQNDRRD